MKICITYIPYPSIEEANKAIEQFLDLHLIACGNVISSQSQYIWNDALCKENETIAILKTSLSCAIKLMDMAQKQHPYKLPAILQWEVNANEGYVTWIEEQTTNHFL